MNLITLIAAYFSGRMHRHLPGPPHASLHVALLRGSVSPQQPARLCTAHNSTRGRSCTNAARQPVRRGYGRTWVAQRCRCSRLCPGESRGTACSCLRHGRTPTWVFGLQAWVGRGGTLGKNSMGRICCRLLLAEEFSWKGMSFSSYSISHCLCLLFFLPNMDTERLYLPSIV